MFEPVFTGLSTSIGSSSLAHCMNNSALNKIVFRIILIFSVIYFNLKMAENNFISAIGKSYLEG
jgi:hypothetical protein